MVRRPEFQTGNAEASSVRNARPRIKKRCCREFHRPRIEVSLASLILGHSVFSSLGGTGIYSGVTPVTRGFNRPNNKDFQLASCGLRPPRFKNLGYPRILLELLFLVNYRELLLKLISMSQPRAEQNHRLIVGRLPHPFLQPATKCDS
jgi:hypothetical protein